MRFADKAVIVNGAASGIGRATAEAFAREGARVLLADAAQRVTDVAAALGDRHIGRVVDVGDEAAVAEMVGACHASFGAVDVLFANAGRVDSIDPIVLLTEEQWLSLLRVNLLGVFFCIKHCAKVMLAQVEAGNPAGNMICTASVAGLRAGAGPAHYSASKAGVINLVQNAAWQLSGSGIRVNAICPGLIETGMTEPIFSMARAAGKEDKIGQLNPQKRAGQPEEIARMVLSLASDDASYVNGEALVVDGGLAASHPVMPGRQW